MSTDTAGGPYVQTAVICETIIRGAETKNLNLINILEGCGIQGTDPDEMPSFTIGPPLKLVINLWGGKARGRYPLYIRPEEPSGLQGDRIKLGLLQFNGQSTGGCDTILPMPHYEITEEGTHWFDVLLSPGGGEEDRLLTRIPFTVQYVPTG
jgi:hypothetical protein